VVRGGGVAMVSLYRSVLREEVLFTIYLSINLCICLYSCSLLTGPPILAARLLRTTPLCRSTEKPSCIRNICVKHYAVSDSNMLSPETRHLRSSPTNCFRCWWKS
jgi:hypothetical protein